MRQVRVAENALAIDTLLDVPNRIERRVRRAITGKGVPWPAGVGHSSRGSDVTDERGTSPTMTNCNVSSRALNHAVCH